MFPDCITQFNSFINIYVIGSSTYRYNLLNLNMDFVIFSLFLLELLSVNTYLFNLYQVKTSVVVATFKYISIGLNIIYKDITVLTLKQIFDGMITLHNTLKEVFYTFSKVNVIFHC